MMFLNKSINGELINFLYFLINFKYREMSYNRNDIHSQKCAIETKNLVMEGSLHLI